MSIEEKAKAYDEAMERFKAFKEKYYTKDTNLGDAIFDKTGEMQKDFESIFPQLRESEDERIRREIIKFIEDFCNPCDTDCDRWIAWLEEQKDKNCLACDQHLKGYLAGRKVREEEKQKENPKSADSIHADCVSYAKCEDRSLKHTYSFGTDIRDTPAYWRGWDDAMKQKEQKPAEWSEEDKEDRKSTRLNSSHIATSRMPSSA